MGALTERGQRICCLGIGSSATAIALISLSKTAAIAQVVSADGTLLTDVTSPDGLNFTIEDGTRAGNNLFHSFQEFSIPTGGSATFNNAADVSVIFGRVTGSNLSDIDGSLSTNSSADLFLLNPNGIIFGPNAQLNLGPGGSFVGSTAEQLNFANNRAFVVSQTVPLLSVSTPTGLQLGTSSRDIQVRDVGYTSLNDRPLTVNSSSSLTVDAGNTLALVGNGIRLTGGTIAAPGGRIELGSVQTGTVGLNATDWALSYKDAPTFADIDLSSQSLLNASSRLFSPTGMPFAQAPQGGNIQLRGRNISAHDGSIALIQNFSNQAFGSILVRASETLSLIGEDTSQEIGSGFATTSFGPGIGGDIDVAAQSFYATRSGNVLAETFGPATGGNIRVAIIGDILFELDRSNPDSGKISSNSYGTGNAGSINVSTLGQLTIEDSGIFSQNFGSGMGGTVNVSAAQLNLSDAASIASAVLGSGVGGDVFVNAHDINITGVDPATFFPSTITTATTQSGNAGNLTITTRRLRLADGGRIDASTFATGKAGTVTVTASESVEIEGAVPGSINPSLIISSANQIDPALRAFFAAQNIIVPAIPGGDSGDVTITTPTLTIHNGAQATVRNDGTGNAGTLTVNANTLFLNNNAGITASTQQGSGGNIRLNLVDVLLLRQGSRLSAEAGGLGNGGNIDLTVPALIALENSDIIANAVQGNGGNIQINAQGIFGTEFRPQLTDESDITASSEFGVSGAVDITSPAVDPASGIVNLPANVVDSSGQIVAGCNSAQSSQFIASGRGGLPVSPNNRLDNNHVWQDIRPLPGESLDGSPNNQLYETSGNITVGRNQTQTTVSPLTEATGWTSNQEGSVVLLAPENNTLQLATTHASCLRNASALEPNVS